MVCFRGLVLLIFISSLLHAQVKRDLLSGDLVKQKKERSPDAGAWKKKVFFGGSLGLQFGSLVFINISPMAGYRITDRIHAGIGCTYNNFTNRIIGRSTNLYGCRGFARYFFMQQFFIHGEQEFLYNKFFFYPDKWISLPLLGIGYRQSLGEHLFFDLTGMWNFNSRANNYYNNPVIRAGFCIR